METAFPTSDPNYDQNYASPGMTLRDYFAAKAMQAWVTGIVTADAYLDERDVAKCAYAQADAMLAERAKVQQ